MSSRARVSDLFGGDAVRFARASVEAEVRGTEMPPIPGDDRFSEVSGAFVTLSNNPSGDLRGCIGIPMPVMPLGDAIRRGAASACHDPRFPDLEEHELPAITVEVTVLTPPVPIMFDDPAELPGLIEVGRDGLIIELFGRSGLLLPQVPVEWGWDETEYLDHLCMKAGLPSGAWMSPSVRMSSFEGEIWKEESPRGRILEVGIDGHRDGHNGSGVH